jgi:DNA-binding beta-propeller fold protein YncE
MPLGVAYDAVNSRLFVADTNCNRVTVYNVAPGFTNGENANTTSGLLGQTSFTANTLHHTATGMDGPTGVAYDPVNQRLFVGDQFNFRVTVYSAAPGFTNGESASYVLGQSTFTGHTGGTTQSSMGGPEILSFDANNSRLFVADNENSRVLVFNVAPSAVANDENASYVIGAANFTTNNNSTTQSTLELDENANYVSSAKYDPATGRLFVSDADNNRVMIFEATYMGNYNFTPGYD